MKTYRNVQIAQMSICPLCSVHQANKHATILFVYKLMVFGESMKPRQLLFFILPSWILKYTIALLMESIKLHTFRLRLRNIRALCTVQSLIYLGNVKWPCSQLFCVSCTPQGSYRYGNQQSVLCQQTERETSGNFIIFGCCSIVFGTILPVKIYQTVKLQTRSSIIPVLTEVHNEEFTLISWFIIKIMQDLPQQKIIADKKQQCTFICCKNAESAETVPQ